MGSEFLVKKSQTGYRVALYRCDNYDVTLVDGLTSCAASP